jgi:hypothetical protein
MDKRTLARGAKTVARYETHVFPADRRRFMIARTKSGQFASVVHLATVVDPQPKEK